MVRRTKEEAEQTRKQILKAALDVFSKKGYSKTTFVDIAREIGLTKGAVYWHFKTKPELLVAMMGEGDQECATEVEKAEVHTLEDLLKLMLGFAKETTENETIQKFEFFTNFQIEWSSELMTEVHQKLQEMRGDPMTNLKELLAKLQASGELRDDADLELMSQSIASVWIGAQNLALMKKISWTRFYTILEQNFTTILAAHSTRPLSGDSPS